MATEKKNAETVKNRQDIKLFVKLDYNLATRYISEEALLSFFFCINNGKKFVLILKRISLFFIIEPYRTETTSNTTYIHTFQMIS